MLLEEFKKLNSDEKLNILFGLFDKIADIETQFINHLSEHKVLKSNLQGMIKTGIRDASLITLAITLGLVTVGIFGLILYIQSFLP